MVSHEVSCIVLIIILNYMNKQQIDFIKEVFSADEIAILEKYFTNIDKPVFGLINLPDVVKGALFARYSRSNKSLRRLFLDEFYKEDSDIGAFNISKAGIERASSLYDKMILDFGDDSVAQLGGAHIACEQVSNILTKIIEKGRIAAYLEQSTRYVYYNEKINGRYHYVIPPEIQNSFLKERYCNYMDLLFETYTEIQERIVPILKNRYPRKKEQSDRAWETTIKAKACDIVRGLLPASTRSNMGIYGNGQFYEYLLVKMYASQNGEVIQYADMLLEELRKIIPAFLTRVDLEDRGKLWSKYIKDIDFDMQNESSAILENISEEKVRQEHNEVKLVNWDDDALDKVLQSAIFEYSLQSEETIKHKLRTLSQEEKIVILNKYVGNRKNRRHKPGRAFEVTSYKFEILSDYGAFRDLQRHRMLTIQWQKLSPKNGYVIPIELEDYPDLKTLYESALLNVQGIYDELKNDFNEDVAQYVIPFAYRVRYEITMNLREAFHFIELRSQKQGHSSYRKVSIDMHNLISKKANHPFFAEYMNFVDTNFYEFSREDAENLIDQKNGKTN